MVPIVTTCLPCLRRLIPSVPPLLPPYPSPLPDGLWTPAGLSQAVVVGPAWLVLKAVERRGGGGVAAAQYAQSAVWQAAIHRIIHPSYTLVLLPQCTSVCVGLGLVMRVMPPELRHIGTTNEFDDFLQ